MNFVVSFDEIIEKLAELGFRLRHHYSNDEDSSENETKNNTDPISMSLEELDFSVSTFVSLKKRRINTVGDLVKYYEGEYSIVGSPSPRPNMNEVREKLAELGLLMKNDEYYE